MKKMNLRLALLAFLLVASTAPAALAQVSGVGTGEFGRDRSGTAGASHLLVPVTARTAALGQSLTSGLQSMNGVEALYTNPAGLVSNPGTSALFSRMNYVADIGVNYAGIAQRFGNNQIAFTVNAWDFGDIPLQTVDAPEVDENLTWSAAFLTAGVSYARQFTDRIAAGVTGKYISERMDNLNSGGMAFDAGMTYVVGESGLRFGVSLKNLGASRSFDGTGLIRFTKLDNQGSSPTQAVAIRGAEYELPSQMNFGFAYTRGFGAGAVVTVLGNFRSNTFTNDQYSGGLELGVRELLFVRGGYTYEQDMDRTFYNGWNAGAGLNLGLAGTQLTLDYAYRSTEFFKGVQMITASIAL